MSKKRRKKSSSKSVAFNNNELKHLDEPDHNTKTYLGDAVFGIEDGLVETLGVTVGVGAAAVGVKIVIIAGVATMFSGAVSMAAGAYLSTKARNQLYYKELAREKREIDEMPEVEREEIRRIYYKKGFRGKDLSKAVKIITSDKDRWLRVMMEEELGMYREHQNNPFVSGALSGSFFMFGALFPVLPYFLFTNSVSVVVSLFLTGLVLFSFGLWKGRHSKINPWKSAFEMLFVGLLAFGIATVVGKILGVK